METRLAIGGNNPPSESEILQQRLESYRGEEKLINDLIARAVPTEIKNDKEAGEIADTIKSLKSARAAIENIFKKEKEPFLVACKVADGWKNAKWTKIDNHVALAGKPIIAWNNKKAEEERARQLELARKAQEEAERLAKEAEIHAEAGIGDTAEELFEFAIEAELKSTMYTNSADGKIATKSAGTYSTASNRKVWVGVVEDPLTLDIVALKAYFTAAEIDKAVRAAISDGVREIRGVKIFEEDKITIR